MKNYISKQWARLSLCVSSLLFLVMPSANAALPDTADPTNAPADGDYLGLLKGYAFDIVIILVLILASIAFLVVAKNCIGVYNEIGAGKKTWGDMGMHGGMGVLLLVLVVYLLNEASTIIF